MLCFAFTLQNVTAAVSLDANKCAEPASMWFQAAKAADLRTPTLGLGVAARTSQSKPSNDPTTFSMSGSPNKAQREDPLARL